MSGCKRSDRIAAMALRNRSKPAEKQPIRTNRNEKVNNHSKEQTTTRPLKGGAIEAVRRNHKDYSLEMYCRPAGKRKRGTPPTTGEWLPSTSIPPELLRTWALKHVKRSSHGTTYDARVRDVKRDPTTADLKVYYRGKGKNRSGKSKAFRWVSVRAASPRTVAIWLKAELESAEEEIEEMGEEHERVSPLQARVELLRDLFEGESIGRGDKRKDRGCGC